MEKSSVNQNSSINPKKKKRKTSSNLTFASSLLSDQSEMNSPSSIVFLKQGIKNSKLTFIFLEQLMIKHQLDKNVKKMNFIKKSTGNSYEFVFDTMHAAEHFTFTIKQLLPVKVNKIFISEKMKENSLSSNSNNPGSDKLNIEQHIGSQGGVHFNVEILPINFDDLICLPKNLYNSFGSQIGPFMLCYRIKESLFFVDPHTAKCVEISPSDYFKSNNNSFSPIFQSNLHLQKYMILSKEETEKDFENKKIERQKENENKKMVDDDFEEEIKENKNKNVKKRLFSVGTVTVVPEDQIGDSNSEFTIKTHLFNETEEGDIWWGYNLKELNSNDEFVMKNINSEKKNINSVILVRKVNPLKNEERIWKLKNSTNSEIQFLDYNNENDLRDFDVFCDILEQKDDLRKQVLMYKNKKNLEKLKQKRSFVFGLSDSLIIISFAFSLSNSVLISSIFGLFDSFGIVFFSSFLFCFSFSFFSSKLISSFESGINGFFKYFLFNFIQFF